MRFLANWTVRRRLMCLMMVSSCATLFVVSVAWLAYDRITSREALMHELALMGEIAGRAAGSAILEGNPQEIEGSLLVFSQRPGVLRSAFYSKGGEVLVSYTAGGSPEDRSAESGGTEGGSTRGALQLPEDGRNYRLDRDRLAVFVPILRDGRTIGTVGIESSFEIVRHRQLAFGGVLVIVLLVCLALAFGLALKLQEVVSGPILLLTSTMRAVSEHKDYSLRARRTANDEVGFLTDAFNEMLAAIRERDRELERHRSSLEEEISQRTRELRTKNQLLQISMDEARAAAVAKSQFLANMSHEIRTPLNGILGLNELVLDSELTDDQRSQIELVGASARSLLTILNDILDFSKIEAGKLSLESIAFDLFRVVEDVVRILSATVHDKGLQMTCWIDPAVPNSLLGDPSRIRQVLTNLVGNAVKFTEEGQVAVRVERLESRTEDVFVKISVSDTGIGIEPGARDRLFESFSQADASTTRKYGGTGLGLAICQQLVEIMGGSIGVESELGEGSTFWFTLPFECVDADPQGHELPRDMDLPPVLVGDDSVAVREAIRQQLIGWGVACRTAKGLEELELELEEARREGDPAGVLLISEELVERCDAEELARLRTGNDLKVAVMAWPSSGGSAPLRELEPDGRLEKPIRPSQLLDALQELVQSEAAERASERADASGPQPGSPAPVLAAGELRILLAEDNAINQMVATRILAKGGFRCDTVETGEQALAALAERDYDVILMDCQMPVMDGFEATRRIRERERAGACPRPVHILALTANALAEDRQRCLDAGMDDYLSKPVAPEALLGKLRALCPDDQARAA